MLVEQVRAGVVGPEEFLAALRQVKLPELGLPGAEAYLAGWARWLAAGGVGTAAPAGSGTGAGAATVPPSAASAPHGEEDRPTVHYRCEACGTDYEMDEDEWAEYVMETRGEPRCTALDVAGATAQGRPVVCWGRLQPVSEGEDEHGDDTT